MKSLLAIIFFTIFHPFTIAQNNNDVLVKIGDKVITVEEFRYRYEFTPQINRKSNDKGKAKENLLYTLIAENLFSIEAEKRGFDTLQAMKMNYVPMEKMHIRDALYQKEISDNVNFDSEKFNKGIKLVNHNCFVDFVYSKEKQPIDNAYKLLIGNSNFDSLVTEIEDVEYVSEPFEVSYGKMYYKAEEAIYNLKMKEFTEPIESPEGWYIFRLISKIPTNFNSIDQKHSAVKKVVEGRIEDSIYNDFWNKFFITKKVTTDGILFWYFAEEIQKLISDINIQQNIKENEKITISNDDFIRFRNTLHPDSLNKIFIQFEENPVTLGDFIIDFAYEGFYTFTTELNQIAAQLNSRVKRQIELELLSRDAYKRGMESLPDVKSSTGIWKDNYLSTLMLKDVVINTELSDSDIKDYLKPGKNNLLSDTQFNILEILTDSLEVIKEALSLSENEIAFRNFAKIHTKREWTKDEGGEFGYFSVSDHSEIGKVAESMEVGDVYGPLQTSEGYSVFKLIDRKESKLNLSESNVDDNTKTKIKYQKIMDNLETMAADLAEKYNVSVNNDLLESLDLLNTQMIVFRYMGFGGRIQAFPYSTPFYKWKEKWEQKKKDLL
jgi:parvulin-like peptidyl-prolyl isomerase